MLRHSLNMSIAKEVKMVYSIMGHTSQGQNFLIATIKVGSKASQTEISEAARKAISNANPVSYFGLSVTNLMLQVDTYNRYVHVLDKVNSSLCKF